eukprot:m.149068 g.149068  ORF g.149068 m.149068 type:complete len:52 (-) comp30633_c2_seq6:220-375(-)
MRVCVNALYPHANELDPEFDPSHASNVHRVCRLRERVSISARLTCVMYPTF